MKQWNYHKDKYDKQQEQLSQGQIFYCNKSSNLTISKYYYYLHSLFWLLLSICTYNKTCLSQFGVVQCTALYCLSICYLFKCWPEENKNLDLLGIYDA